MAREPKQEHRPLLAKITEKAEAEERARARAAAQVREATLVARSETNTAIANALAQGVTKEAVREILGVSYTTVVNRMSEHNARVGYVTSASVPAAASQPNTTPMPDPSTSVTATKDDTGYTVTLDGFSHPDVGDDLTGTAIYDIEGEFKAGDFAEEQAGDPLWADKLWATKEVQRAVENA